MGGLRVVQISDLHLSTRIPRSMEHFAEVRRRIAELRPDLVVVTGDVCANPFDTSCLGEREHAKDELDQVSPPVYVLPGNHDVGDKVSLRQTQPWSKVSRRTIDEFRAVFGADCFGLERGPWMLIGLNSQLADSGLPDEARQWAWLDEGLAAAEAGGKSVAIFTHVPPFLDRPDEIPAEGRDYWVWDAGPRRELIRRLRRQPVRLICTGHLHWRSDRMEDGVRHIGCPSTAFVADDIVFPSGGDDTGMMLLELGDDVSANFVALPARDERVWCGRPTVEPPGWRRITLGHLVLDFTGTLSLDGSLLPGVAECIRELAKSIRITVMTADTFGKARQALPGLPVEVRIIRTGADKERYVHSIGPPGVVAIGNGRNDVRMVRAAGLGIAVIGPEGAAGELVAAADVVTRDIRDALGLVANPLRLKATLRE